MLARVEVAFSDAGDRCTGPVGWAGQARAASRLEDARVVLAGRDVALRSRYSGSLMRCSRSGSGSGWGRGRGRWDALAPDAAGGPAAGGLGWPAQL